MSVNRLLLTFRSSDALRMHLNLVSVGILMVMVGSAFAGAMQQHQHQLDPGAGLARTEPSAHLFSMSDIQRPESAARHNAATGLDVDDSPIMDAGAPASISKNDDDVQPGGAVPTIPPTTSTTTIGNAVPGATTVDLGFIHGFIASLSVILVSELGDKTFFIAAIMAMRHPRLVVFAGAIGALGLMTVLSAVFGMAATIIPRVYTYYISTALFAIFGLKMLYDGWNMSDAAANEELEEVQSDLKKREEELRKSSKVNKEEKVDAEEGGNDPLLVVVSSSGLATVAPPANANGASMSDLNAIEMNQFGSSGSNAKRESKLVLRTNLGSSSSDKRGSVAAGLNGSVRSLASSRGGSKDKYVLSKVLMQAFTMTFLAEWGDRSQLTTIILSAREDIPGVIVGGVLGHSLCTGLAVIGGRMVAQRISVRTVTLVGGVVFLLFALSALIFGPGEEKPVEPPLP